MARDDRDYAAQRAQLQEARQRTRELSTLLDISMALPATTDLSNLLNAIITKSVELFEAADAGVLFLYDPEDEALIARSSVGYRQEPLSEVRLRPGEAIAGKVFQRGEPLLCSDPREIAEAMESVGEENRSRLDEARGDLAQPLSAVSVPLISRGSVLGSLVLVNLHRYAAFSPGDARFLQAIANEMAIVVQNGLLYDELQQKERLRGELLAKVISAEEEERKRIARELHDEAIQALSAVLVQLSAIEEGLRPGAKTREQIAEVRNLMVGAISEVRKAMLGLRPSGLDDLGLVPALRSFAAERLEEAGVTLHWDASGLSRRLPAEMETALFRIVQEAVNNAVRHAEAETVRIGLREEDGLVIAEVEDDGLGFDVAHLMRRRSGEVGLGLLGMRERASLFGGTMDVHSGPEQGTRIRIEIPFQDEGEAE